jgi:hypothetical protein
MGYFTSLEYEVFNAFKIFTSVVLVVHVGYYWEFVETLIRNWLSRFSEKLRLPCRPCSSFQRESAATIQSCAYLAGWPDQRTSSSPPRSSLAARLWRPNLDPFPDTTCHPVSYTFRASRRRFQFPAHSAHANLPSGVRSERRSVAGRS